MTGCDQSILQPVHISSNENILKYLLYKQGYVYYERGRGCMRACVRTRSSVKTGSIGCTHRFVLIMRRVRMLTVSVIVSVRHVSILIMSACSPCPCTRHDCMLTVSAYSSCPRAHRVCYLPHPEVLAVVVVDTG